MTHPRSSDGPLGRPLSVLGRRQMLLGVVASALFATSCKDDEPELRVDLSRRRTEVLRAAESEVRFAIGTMISPRDSLEDYLALAYYLQERVERPVRLVQRRGYAETNALLDSGEVDMAFISTGPFIDARRAGASLLAVPVFSGGATCRSLLVVRNNDPARSVEDLRGSSFAFADPMSFTGRIYPETLVRSLSDGGVFFGRTVFTHAHSDSLAMVADSRVRATSVEDIVFEYLKQHYPERVAGLRVLHASPLFPGPPFVGRPGLPNEIKVALQKTLLEMDQDPEGRSVLHALGFTRLATLPESAYDEVAELWEAVLGPSGRAQ